MSGIGLGAPGLGAPPPSPGVRAMLHVRHETHWPDGEIHVREWSHEWDGYTATEAVTARLKRLRDAKSDVTRDGMTLVVRIDHGPFVSVDRLTFEDT